MDHIISHHNIMVVVASGNKYYDDETIEKVVSTGMAYNVITVGSFNDGNTDDRSNDQIAPYSLYIEDDGLAEKPDIVAPGTNISLSALGDPSLGGESGTSFAAPQVAGTLVQLMYASNNLKYRPSFLVM